MKIPTDNPCNEVRLADCTTATQVQMKDMEMRVIKYMDDSTIALRDMIMDEYFAGIPYEELLALAKEKYPERFI